MTYVTSEPPEGIPLDAWEECMKIGEEELGLTFIDKTIDSKMLKNGNDAIEVGIAKAKKNEWNL